MPFDWTLAGRGLKGFKSTAEKTHLLSLKARQNGKQKREPVARACRRHSVVFYVMKKSRMAFFMTCRPTSAIEVVSGICFGQISRQFCA